MQALLPLIRGFQRLLLNNLPAAVEGIDGRRDAAEDIFPETPEGSDFLVGDADALELSYLDAGAF